MSQPDVDPAKSVDAVAAALLRYFTESRTTFVAFESQPEDVKDLWRGAAKAGMAVLIDECLAVMPCTAENPKEDAYQLGKFDGVIEYQRALRALLKGTSNES